MENIAFIRHHDAGHQLRRIRPDFLKHSRQPNCVDCLSATAVDHFNHALFLSPQTNQTGLGFSLSMAFVWTLIVIALILLKISEIETM